jgi:hypothetical protein
LTLFSGFASVIRTGQADLIEKAMEASKRIKTPLKELSDRYSETPGFKESGKLDGRISDYWL